MYIFMLPTEWYGKTRKHWHIITHILHAWAKHTGTDQGQAGTITAIKRLDLDHRVSVGWQ